MRRVNYLVSMKRKYDAPSPGKDKKMICSSSSGNGDGKERILHGFKGDSAGH